MKHLKSIKIIEQEISQEFEIFDTWMEKYEYLIDLGKQLENFPDEWKTEDNKIHGCQSSVWFKTGLVVGWLGVDSACKIVSSRR